MASTDITARPVALAELLDGVADATVVLPDFQRDFDWSPNEVVSLVATVMVGWPAGSLLLMRGKPDFFDTRAFETVDRHASAISYVVLDGQQRLTALYQVFRGQGPRIYALRYRGLAPVDPPVDSIEDAIFSVDQEEWRSKWGLERQAAEGVMPLYALASAPDFFEWRDLVVSASKTSRARAVADHLTLLYRNLLGNVNHYDFPSVVLDRSLEPEPVARIFERINRTGQRLNSFDLLVARVYENGWNLRDKWEEALGSEKGVERFLGDDGLPVLQVIALRAVGDVRQPALLRLDPNVVRDSWDDAVAAVGRAASFLSGWGASGPDFVPHKAMIVTLGGLAWDAPKGRSAERELERWFWRSGLSGSYDVASSTRIVADYRAVRSAITGGTPVPPPAVGREQLFAATRRSRPAIWRTMNALLDRDGGYDLVTGEVLDPSERTLTSILPREFVVGDWPRRVLGMVALNKSSVALAAEIGTPAAGGGIRYLSSQYLPPPDKLRKWRSADPERLFDWRLSRILTDLEADLGAPVVRLETESGTTSL